MFGSGNCTRKVEIVTFYTWTKKLLLEEVSAEGKTVVTKSGWYCLTPYGFLYRVFVERESLGFFSLYYEVIPLIVPLKYQNDQKISTAREEWANLDFVKERGMCKYDAVLGMDVYSEEWPLYMNLRVRDFEKTDTYERCAEIIHEVINPRFAEIKSIESYYNSTIQHFRAMVDSSTHQNTLAQAKLEYPPDYPIYANAFGGAETFALVCCYLGKYREAVAGIRGTRENRLRTLEHNRKFPYLTEEMYICQRQEIIENYNEIELAALNEDKLTCERIFEKNYLYNRSVIQDVLKLIAPENWKEIVA